MYKRMFLLVMVTLLLVSCSVNTIFNSGKRSRDVPLAKHSFITKSSTPADFIPVNLKIVSIGDSLTQGVGDSQDKGGYIPYLKTMLEQNRGINDAIFTNFGKRGNRSGQLLTRLHSIEVKNEIEQADVIIMTIGGNDIMKIVREKQFDIKMSDFNKEILQYEQRLRVIYTLLRQYNSSAEIYLLGLYNPFIKWFSFLSELDVIMDDWNQIGRNIAENEPKSYFVEIDDIFAQSKENLLYTDDYFHPNDEGYLSIATRMYKEMKEHTVRNLPVQSEANLKEKRQ